MAPRQGGLGLILTVLIVTAPPMAAAFFQGMLGAFTPYTAFSSDGGARASRDGRWGGGNSYPPGHGGNPGGVQPMSHGRNGGATPDGNVNAATYNQSLGARVTGADGSAPEQAMPKKGFKSSEA